MQMKSKAIEGKTESDTRSRKDLKVVEVEFLPMPEAKGRLSQVYDLLLSPRLHEGEDQEG